MRFYKLPRFYPSIPVLNLISYIRRKNAKTRYRKPKVEDRPLGGLFFLRGRREYRMTRREIRDRVIACKKNTVMANAFRRAFGMKPIYSAPSFPIIINADAFADIEHCFANSSSPMDKVYG